MSDRLKGKVAFVTGGASGIGAATVRRFVEEGASVIFTDVQADLGQALAKETGAEFQVQDVTDEGLWSQILDGLKSKYGRLDTLVNNAGIFLPGSIEDMTTADMRKILEVNLVAVGVGCREGVRIMKENPGGPSGSLVNVSSITGFVGIPAAAAYTASKGAVRLMTKSIARHVGAQYRNIRCNSVHPGAIDTPMNQAAFEAADDPQAIRDYFSTLQPIGRMTEAEEVAGAILYMASDDASSVNGTELLVDGGWLAGPGGM
jgi:NAD(P)-dependent dehydrogenase (short-subunit alcohol dehydrogenase family)